MKAFDGDGNEYVRIPVNEWEVGDFVYFGYSTLILITNIEINDDYYHITYDGRSHIYKGYQTGWILN